MCTSCAPLTAVSQAIILRENLTACQELSDEACGQNRNVPRTWAQLEDIERHSPLGYDHIRMHGQYHFTLAEPVQKSDFLPLRAWEESEEIGRD